MPIPAFAQLKRDMTSLFLQMILGIKSQDLQYLVNMEIYRRCSSRGKSRSSERGMVSSSKLA